MSRLISRILLIAFSTLALTTAARSQPVPEELNAVKMEIYKGSILIGKPIFIMEIGSTAVATYEGREGYSVKAKLSSSTKQKSRSRMLDVELFTAQNDRWVLEGNPALETALNEGNSVTIPGSDGQSITIKILVEDNFKYTSSVSFGKNKCTAAKLVLWKDSMSKSVSALKSVALQGGGCCQLCNNYQCCSSGPMCCLDPYKCSGSRCCNGM